RNEIDPFLHKLTTCDKKCLLQQYAAENVMERARTYLTEGARKEHWLQEDHPTCLVGFEAHRRPRVLFSKRNYECGLHEDILEKRPTFASRKGVVFHQDNARPPVSVKT
ncbi:unnamed protein product, partial [Ixodes hexagonus]